MQSITSLFRAFFTAETGGTGLEFTLIAAGVGLALSGVLYVVGGALNEQYEAIAFAMKHQNK